MLPCLLSNNSCSVHLQYEFADCWVLWCSFEVEQVLGFKPELYTVFNGLLLTLVVLHVYWFAIICNIALQKVLEGKDVADVREAEQ